MQEKDILEKPLRVGIVGSRTYEHKKRIKDFCFHLKNNYGDGTVVVSGGCPTGADRYAKKYALELGLQYEEFPPAHHQHNLYCRFPKEQYGKPYKVSNFFKRNKQIAIFSDVVIAFVTFGSESPGSMYTINAAKKLDKKTKVFH